MSGLCPRTLCSNSVLNFFKLALIFSSSTYRKATSKILNCIRGLVWRVTNRAFNIHECFEGTSQKSGICEHMHWSLPGYHSYTVIYTVFWLITCVSAIMSCFSFCIKARSIVSICSCSESWCEKSMTAL